MKIERRFIKSTELRAETQGDQMALVGYASMFGQQSEDLGGFRETVMPGAFARSIREGADVKCLMNHDPSLIMGRTKNKTLTLEEDAKGLKFRVVLPPTQAARDLHALVSRGDMDQCSFAFTARDQEWADERDGNGDLYASRKLMDVDLMDVSAVTYPAYTGTQVSARDLFPEGEPVEVRSALDATAAAKALAQRGSENQPPSGSVIDGPNPSADEKLREAWLKAFNDKYDELKKKGGKGWDVKQVIGMATAYANQQAQPATEVTPAVSGQAKEPTAIKGDTVQTDAYGRYLRRQKEVRYSEGTLEDQIEDVNCALKDKYGMAAPDKCWPGCPKYWVVETYPDHAIIIDNDEDCYYDIPYTYDSSMEPGEEVTLGEMKPVEQEYVPSERALKVAEARIYKTAADAPDHVPADKKKQWVDVWNSAYKKAKKDGKSDADAEGSAFAQANGVAKRDDAADVSDPDSDSYDPEDPNYDPSLDETDGEGRASERDGQKTKKVAGKDLTADSFAYVGDPDKTATWKLPIHDEGHARNALARFGQTKGIPADKKDAVWKKIVAAAKKFGIQVTEEDSLRAAVPHSSTQAILNEIDSAVILDAVKARMRLIEIDLS